MATEQQEFSLDEVINALNYGFFDEDPEFNALVDSIEIEVCLIILFYILFSSYSSFISQVVDFDDLAKF
jgi:hypothetical protein